MVVSELLCDSQATSDVETQESELLEALQKVSRQEHGGTWEPGRNSVGHGTCRQAAACGVGGPGKLEGRDLLQKQE